MHEFAVHSTQRAQEDAWSAGKIRAARETAAKLIGAAPGEVALIGPTSVGLSLVANGLPWQPGDEVVFYQDDYPANVYPWRALEERGVKPVSLRPALPGVITWDVVEHALTPKTRLVSLATCHFLSGYRIDVDTIGVNLGQREILFCVDAIQTLGAFPLSIRHIDFLSADSHKWMLGPCGAGVFYVRASRQDLLKPTLVGAWNFVTPDYVAQEVLRPEKGARRYEPGALNLAGIIGMAASLEFLIQLDIEKVGRRILELRRKLLDALRSLGFHLYLDAYDSRPSAVDNERSGIVALTHPTRDIQELVRRLIANGVIVSLRRNRDGTPFVRFSPHFYNTEAEIERVVESIKL
jgi:selenocysteine lyase/cysteine desulfurase